MPRRTRPRFHFAVLADLVRQLQFAPTERRREQLRRAERLHDQIDPDTAYPLEFIVYRITGYRSEYHQEDLLAGGALLPDLRLFIDQLSYALDKPEADDRSGEADPWETAAQAAARLNVSSRTLVRWRQRGLRWRWEILDDGQKHLVYPRSATDLFVARHPDLTVRARRFSQMSPTDTAAILRRARKLAQAGDFSLNQVASHLARRTGRAVETIRQLLRKHDQKHPAQALFAGGSGPLTTAQKHEIARLLKQGATLPELVRRFRKTRSTLRRAVNDIHAAELRRREIRYMELPSFALPEADELYAREAPTPADRPDAPYVPPPTPVEDLPASIQPIYRGPTIPPERAHALLVRMNYLRYRAAHRRDALDRYEPRATQLTHIDTALRQAEELRQTLIRAGLPLVLAVARQHLVGQADPDRRKLLELLLPGNLTLLECIDHFDIRAARSFESYLNWSLMRRLATFDAGDAGPDTRAHRRDDAHRLEQRLRDQAAQLGLPG